MQKREGYKYNAISRSEDKSRSPENRKDRDEIVLNRIQDEMNKIENLEADKLLEVVFPETKDIEGRQEYVPFSKTISVQELKEHLQEVTEKIRSRKVLDSEISLWDYYGYPEAITVIEH